MSPSELSEKLNPYEKLLVASETFPWDALYRGAIGFLTLPLFARVWKGHRSEWMLVPFLLLILLMLRLIPGVVRRVVPFPAPVKSIWTTRRRMAKRYDSYQWQKLFWIGVGLAVYTVHSGQYLISRIVVASVCLVGGGIGLAIWRGNSLRMNPAPMISKQA